MVFSAMSAVAAVHGRLFRSAVTIHVDLSGHGSDREARLWIPYPVSDQNQKITDISVSGTEKGWAVYTDRRWKNPMLYAYWAPGQRRRVLTFSFHVERNERLEQWKLADDGMAYQKAFAERYLSCRDHQDKPGRVASLSESIVAGKSTPVEKARTVYQWVTANMRRDPATRGCGQGNVCVLIDRRSGKCVDINSVFVALLNAAGVPAREVFGIRLGQTDRTDITHWQHCWAEFYLPDAGWVPADPADYLKALLKQGLCPDSQEARRIRSYFLGNVDPYRVRLSTGRDIVLNPPASYSPLNYLMYIHAEIGGDVPDPLDSEHLSYTIVSSRLDGADSQKGLFR